MAIPLVIMFPNSTTRALAGIWNNNPGDNKMNRTTATTTGPQSALILLSGFGDMLNLMGKKTMSLRWRKGMEIVKRRGGTEINISNKPNQSNWRRLQCSTIWSCCYCPLPSNSSF